MRKIHILILVGMISALCLTITTSVHSQVKWSAPMQSYPNQWSPTAAPPSYNNPYGYQYPYADYGYGPYQGYPPGTEAYQGQVPNQQGYGFSGNPYYYNYYSR